MGASGCGIQHLFCHHAVAVRDLAEQPLAAAAATAVTMWLYFFAAERLDHAMRGELESVPFLLWLAAGISASFAAANELPALSMMVFWFLLVAMLDRASILPFLLGVAIVAIGFFGTNWLAHESLRPPYMHRGNGRLDRDACVHSRDSRFRRSPKRFAKS